MSKKVAISSYVPSTPLALACESLKPNVVLLLLRYGSCPLGKPLDQIFSTLGSQRIVERATGMMIGDIPLEHVKLCLEYCLRAVRRIKIRTGDETTVDVAKGRDLEHVHYVKEHVLEYLPDECYKAPTKLKHLARCQIRDILFTVDRMPEGIEQLPVLDNDCKKYVNLLS